jgi:glycerol uptake facilitator-like aquaporin
MRQIALPGRQSSMALYIRRIAGFSVKAVSGSLRAIASRSDKGHMTTGRRPQFGLLIRNSVLELILTSVLLFGVTTIVRFVVGPSPVSRALPEIHFELFIVGALVAVLLAGLIISRPGKISGGHMNPAISLAMWRFGVFPAAGIVPYIAAQLLGSVVGVLAARAAWGAVVERPPVLYAVIRPGPAWSAASLFGAELIGMGLIVFTVGYFLSIPRLAPLVPWLVGILIGLGIALLGTQSGGSLNPARQFGPAVMSGYTAELWVFLIAPMVGAELAARLLKAFRKGGEVLTHRLCGTRVSGSEFRVQSSEFRVQSLR